MYRKETRTLASSVALVVALACGGAPPEGSSVSPPNEKAPETSVQTDGPFVVQPGAPGEASRTLSAEELASMQGLAYTEADVRFMQGMIPHHAQALEMTALVPEHATTDAVRQMALRMEISQRDEIALMESWLRRHGEPVKMPAIEGMHGAHGGHMMPGMLTPEQMDELRASRGVDFDRLFLEYMIQHHEGAIVMVSELFMRPGAAQESAIFKFAEEVDADQAMEIARMQRVLQELQ